MSHGFFFFFLFLFSSLYLSCLFFLSVFYIPGSGAPSPHKHQCCPEFFSPAGVVSSMPVLWREKVKVLCSKRCGLTPLNPPSTATTPTPKPPSPLLFSPSGQTVFMLLDEWKKKKKRESERERERGNFYLLWRFSPRQNSKLNSVCLDFSKKKQKMTKDNIRHFCFILSVFATETWAKRASTRLRGGSVSDRYWRDRLQRGNEGDVHCWRACVCVHECVC